MLPAEEKELTQTDLTAPGSQMSEGEKLIIRLLTTPLITIDAN